MKASLFAPAHLAWISGIAVVAAATALLCRRHPAGVTLVNLRGLLFCLLWIPVRRSAL